MQRGNVVAAPPAPQALVTVYSYDPDGRLVGTKQSASGAALAATSAAYTPSGQLASATDANGNITRYAYDAADRLGYGDMLRGYGALIFSEPAQRRPSEPIFVMPSADPPSPTVDYRRGRAPKPSAIRRQQPFAGAL